MENLFTALADLIIAAKDVLISLVVLLLPWITLFAWVLFWSFGVDWQKLRLILRNGGWIGVVLIGIVAVLVWGTVSPPPLGHYDLLGLRISNYVGKTVYVSGLICLMLLAGSVQLSGACNRFLCFPADADDDDLAHDHDNHGHASVHH